MTKRPLPLEPSNRDAPALHAGIAYQKIVTLHAWLALEDDEILFIELGEDFLRHGAAGGVAVQVRGTQRPLSLAGVEARQIIESAFERPVGIATAYWTTSPPGREKGLYKATQTSGVELWSRAARGDDAALEVLRRYLTRRGGWSPALTAALRDQTPEELRISLFGRIQWDLRQLPTATLESRAKVILTDRLRARSSAPGHTVNDLLPRCLDRIEKVARLAADDRHLDRHKLELAIEETIANAQTVAALSAGVTVDRPAKSMAAFAEALAGAYRRLGAISAADLESARLAGC
jgi:hypothetical protein